MLRRVLLALGVLTAVLIIAPDKAAAQCEVCDVHGDCVNPQVGLGGDDCQAESGLFAPCINGGNFCIALGEDLGLDGQYAAVGLELVDPKYREATGVTYLMSCSGDVLGWEYDPVQAATARRASARLSV